MRVISSKISVAVFIFQSFASAGRGLPFRGFRETAGNSRRLPHNCAVYIIITDNRRRFKS